MLEIKHIALLLPLLASIMTVGGQLLYKDSATIKRKGDITYKWIIALFAGNLLFLFAIISNFFAMKFIPLFVVYAFTALNYVFVTIASRVFLGEEVKKNNIFASMLIASGVLLTTIKY
jgi:drug/metabolite transporter (DMT)-like permease